MRRQPSAASRRAMPLADARAAAGNDGDASLEVCHGLRSLEIGAGELGAFWH